jgi:hypothetical protein
MDEVRSEKLEVRKGEGENGRRGEGENGRKGEGENGRKGEGGKGRMGEGGKGDLRFQKGEKLVGGGEGVDDVADGVGGGGEEEGF